MAGLRQLSKFPPELIEKILDGLCVHHIHSLREHEDKFTWSMDFNPLGRRLWTEPSSLTGLASLCRASKQLNQLATWRLYHTLVAPESALSWLLLARTLIERRDLAALVRHFYLDHLRMPEDPSLFPPEVMAYYAEQVALVPDAGLNETSLTEPDESDPYGVSQYDAALALMASLCPNLSTGGFVAGAASGNPSTFTLCPPATMLPLREVQVAHWDTECGFDLSLLTPLFRAAPNLRLLRLIQVGCDEPLEEGLRLEHLTDLELPCSCNSADELVRMLRLCPNLRRLQYVCGGALYGDEQFSPQQAVAAVLEHAPNLQTFELDLMDGLGMEDFDEEDVREAKEALEQRGIECKFTEGYESAGLSSKRTFFT
jgi:hypothetical protein